MPKFTIDTNLEAVDILNAKTEPKPAQCEYYPPERTRKQSWYASPSVDCVGVLDQTKCDHVVQGAICFNQKLEGVECRVL